MSVAFTETSAQLAAISRWVDEHPANAERSHEAKDWGRIAKVGEEFGEVINAYIGATGQNPRKGVFGCIDDVVTELLDVALSALAAVEHFNGNDGGTTMQMLADHVEFVHGRSLESAVAR